MLYGGVAAGGGALFLLLAFRVWRSHAGDNGNEAEKGLYGVKAGSKDARNLFAFSIIYLFMLFLALLAEHAIGVAPLRLIG